MSAEPSWRVLIVSRHPLFGDGLSRLLTEQAAQPVQILGRCDSLAAAAAALDELRPNLVIVDHDDDTIRREDFLTQFVHGDYPLRLVLVSLKEAGPLTVYERRIVGLAQIETWLQALLPGAEAAPLP